MKREEKLVERLLQEIPEFRDVYEEHLSFNGELLAYVLIGELGAFASAAYAKGDKALVERIIRFINETVVSFPSAIRGMIRVSFLWKLPDRNGYEYMRALLNEQALAMLREELSETAIESEN